MPNNRDDQLHLLIKSLTKNEKKQLSQILNKENTSNLYVLLFNDFANSSTNPKELIKKHFGSKVNQLPVIKTYLTNVIEKFLINNSSPTPQEQTSYLLQISENYIKRELYRLADSRIEKCLRTTSDYEQFSLYLQAIELKKLLLKRQNTLSATDLKKQLNYLLAEEEIVLKQIENIKSLEKIDANFYEYFQKGSGISPSLFTTLLKNPLIINDNATLSLTAKILQSELRFRIYVYKNQDYQNANIALQTGIRNLELSPGFIAFHPHKYLHLLNQLLELQIHLKDIPEIKNILQKIKSAAQKYNFDAEKPDLKRSLMEALSIEFEIAKNSHEPAYITQIIQRIDSEQKKLNSPLLKQWRSYFNLEIAKHYFSLGNISQCLKRLKSITSAEYSHREKECLLESLLLEGQIAMMHESLMQTKKSSKQIDQFFKNIKRANRLEKHVQKTIHLWTQYYAFPKKHQHLLKQLDLTINSFKAKPQNEIENFINFLVSSKTLFS